MSQNIIRDRFIEAFKEIEKQDSFKDKTDFGKKLGVKVGTITEILGKRQGVTTEVLQQLFDVFNVRYDFIFRGDYPIFNRILPLANNEESSQLSEKPAIYQISKPIQKTKSPLIPFYDIDFAAGNVSFYDDPTASNYSYQLDIPEFSGCIGFRVYGDSMMPLISSGSMVFGTKIENWNEHLEYGRIYGIVCQDGHKFIKYIRRHPFKSEERFILRSENNAYDDFDLEKSNIRNIWLIHGWVIKVV